MIRCIGVLVGLLWVLAGAAGAETLPLDISSAFNVDAWCGPLEIQDIYTYAAAHDPDKDLGELQGGTINTGVGWNVVGQGYLLVSEATVGGCAQPYSISGQWFHPKYLTGSEGTPEDGVLAGGDARPYHLASVLGNGTLIGDWLEAADPGAAWEIVPNVVVIGAAHNRLDWQISSVTIELPAGQKGCYADVNFVLAAMNMSDRARNMRIVALYGNDGSDTVVLYSFATADGGSGPKMVEQSGGADFAIVHNFSKVYGKDVGTTGGTTTVAGSLYEFAAPLELDPSKTLWGFRLEDTNPTLTNNARGLAVLAATVSPADNVLPVANAGSDQSVTDNDLTQAETVTLDASGSYDSDGAIVSWTWKEGGAVIATGQTAQVSLSIRLHAITLEVTDDDGGTAADTVNVRVYAAPPPLPLNLSGGFNMDIWCGPLELQDVYNYAVANNPDKDLAELQGASPAVGVGWNVLGAGHLLDCLTSTSGSALPYSISGQWNHPRYLAAPEGTPEDGVISTADRDYHLASAQGNATLAGNWLEVADPGAAWATRPNAVVVGALATLNLWQVSSATIELPAAQKGRYSDVNFVLAAMNLSDRARNLRIVALYGASGTDTEVLYSFATADGGSGPKMVDATAGTGFAIVYSFTKAYGKDVGATGGLTNLSGNLFEFAEPLELNPAKDLWGFRVEDVNPTLANNARGLTVLAATATSTDDPGWNLAPVADAGADQGLTDNDGDSVVTFTLDGAESDDPDGDVAAWVWSVGATQLATGESAEATLGLGTHTITLTITDNEGGTASDTIVVTLSAAGAADTFFVDYDSGSDANNGLSYLTPFQHAPGDPAATGTAATTTVSAGDTVRFKGGVHYRGRVVVNGSGADGSPIVFDGNTTGIYGTGRAIIDGSENLTGWAQCASADDCDGNANWQNIYYTYAPSGTTLLTANLWEDDGLLWVAQHPNLTDGFFADDTTTYLTFDSATDTTIVDADYFTQAAGYWDGATHIRIHGGANNVFTRAVTGYVPVTHTIQYASFGQTHYNPGSYAMCNSLKVLDQAGEYVVRTDQTNGSGGPKIYLWPRTAGVSGKEITVSVRPDCFHLNGKSYVTVQGFVLQKTNNAEAAVRGALNADTQQITISDNVVTRCGGSGIILDDLTNSAVADNEITLNHGRGILLSEAFYSTISGNFLEKNGETAIDYYYSEHSSILSNTVLGHRGVHANGITVYLDSDDILIAGNIVMGGRAACTLQASSNLTVAYNVLDGNDTYYALADWNDCVYLYIYNNITINGGVTIGSGSNYIYARNNIMDGSHVKYFLQDAGIVGASEDNLYISLAWTQNLNNLGTGEFVVTDLDAIWADPDNNDYHLLSTSPAVDAGVDVGLELDLEGNPVPTGNAPDIGPYEYVP